jgi:fatty acid desaturase
VRLIWLVSSTYGLLWALPLIVVQGYFVAFLFMVVHETAHKTAFRSRALNLALGHLSSFAIGLPYEYYCLFHWDHHRYTQDPDRDPELLVGPMPASDTQLAIAYTGLRRLPSGWADASPCLYRQRSAPWIPGRQAPHRREGSAPLCRRLCSCCCSPRWRSIRASALGLDRSPDRRPADSCALSLCRTHRLRTDAQRLQNTRTTYTGMVMKWFAWNMPYHVEHHAYPSIPFHALPKLNAIVDDRSFSGQGYPAVTRETWAWFRRRAARPARRQRLLIISRVSTRLRACAGEIGLIPKM